MAINSFFYSFSLLKGFNPITGLKHGQNLGGAVAYERPNYWGRGAATGFY